METVWRPAENSTPSFEFSWLCNYFGSNVFSFPKGISAADLSRLEKETLEKGEMSDLLGLFSLFNLFSLFSLFTLFSLLSPLEEEMDDPSLEDMASRKQRIGIKVYLCRSVNRLLNQGALGGGKTDKAGGQRRAQY